MNTGILQKRIIPILKRQGVLQAAFFGSVARNTPNPQSDVDLLIRFPRNQSLLDLVNLKLILEKKLGRSVDVVSYGGINKLLQKTILKEQKIFYVRQKRS